jgi:hypothetical protein
MKFSKNINHQTAAHCTGPHGTYEFQAKQTKYKEAGVREPNHGK